MGKEYVGGKNKICKRSGNEKHGQGSAIKINGKLN